ncbi:MAG: hypothetical protein J1F39_03210 [Clostridiales bacterium]|nr:hypothetical protein [Clostridiales bacterium]
MKDRTARVLAIIALVTMGLFVAALIATFIDPTIFNGSIGFIALGLAVFTLMVFIALKADGRGFSMTKINNEIEMKKIEEELAKKEQAEKTKSENASDEMSSENTGDTTDSPEVETDSPEKVVDEEIADGE